MLVWDRYIFQKKRTGTRYAKLMFLHPVGCVCHTVHCGVSRARNVDTLFFLLCWDWYGFHKKASGQLMPNLCRCIRWYSWVTWCILVPPGREMSTHYFSCSGGNGAVFIKSTSGHFPANLCFCIRWDMWVT
jgi:hypothetical protein